MIDNMERPLLYPAQIRRGLEVEKGLSTNRLRALRVPNSGQTFNKQFPLYPKSTSAPAFLGRDKLQGSAGSDETTEDQVAWGEMEIV